MSKYLNKPSFFKLIKGGTLFDPENRGTQDILIAGNRIAKVSKFIDINGLDLKVFDASDKIVVPGFIDLHVHLLGGGGEAGPASRVPELSLSKITEAGITTVVGVLGTDNITRSPEALLSKAQALCAEGISAYVYTGSYHVPSVTVTGSIRKDIALIREVLGVKIAISDHRGSQLTTGELVKVASEARIGGLLGGKKGIVHVHVGVGSAGLTPLLKVVELSEIPITQFLPTHICRTTSLLKEGIKFVKQGGYIDLTAPSDSLVWEEDFGAIMERIISSGIDIKNVTLSSDGNGSMAKFDENGDFLGLASGEVTTLHRTFRDLVINNIMSTSEALKMITSNPADRLGISGQKGRIAEGKDADIVTLDKALKIEQVFAKGQLMVDGGKAVVQGVFE